jgi:signal peptidase I
MSDMLQTILMAFGLFLVIYFFLFRPFQVSGYSMFPTYKDREYLLTNLIGLRINGVKRGDVIVFKAPVDKEKDYIKRIIGLPGETISVHDTHVYINGKELGETVYLHDVKTNPGAYLEEGKTVTIPKEHYIVMGDNRTGSSDSREWGFITRDEIIGKALFVYWPISAWRVIHNPFTTKS